jgi:hypothetical protein
MELTTSVSISSGGFEFSPETNILTKKIGTSLLALSPQAFWDLHASDQKAAVQTREVAHSK